MCCLVLATFEQRGKIYIIIIITSILLMYTWQWKKRSIFILSIVRDSTPLSPSSVQNWQIFFISQLWTKINQISTSLLDDLLFTLHRKLRWLSNATNFISDECVWDVYACVQRQPTSARKEQIDRTRQGKKKKEANGKKPRRCVLAKTMKWVSFSLAKHTHSSRRYTHSSRRYTHSSRR